MIRNRNSVTFEDNDEKFNQTFEEVGMYNKRASDKVVFGFSNTHSKIVLEEKR